MEAKNRIVLEYPKGERVYSFEMPHAAPLGEAYEAAGAFLDRIIELIQSHQEARKASEEEVADGDA